MEVSVFETSVYLFIYYVMSVKEQEELPERVLDILEKFMQIIQFFFIMWMMKMTVSKIVKVVMFLRC